MKLAIAMLAVTLGAPPARALSQSHLTVVTTGSEANGTQVCVAISPNPDNCPYGCVYFQDPRELGKVLAIATAAHVSRDTVRADYNLTNGLCIGFGLYIGQ